MKSIAVTDCGNPEKQQLYMNWLRSFDERLVLKIISYRDDNGGADSFDGLVLTGGEDVDPILSKAMPEHLVEETNRKRDDFEFRLLEKAMSIMMPILGICRGLQVTNVFLGGTLIADLPSAGFLRHSSRKNEPALRHDVTLIEGSHLHAVTGTLRGEINSYHHQSVRDTADDLRVTGSSPDGVIEALEWKEQGNKSFLQLVQWHPERMTDRSNPFSHTFASSFVSEILNKK